jgi:hypothetical protein
MPLRSDILGNPADRRALHHDCSRMWELPRPEAILSSHYNCFIQLCRWQVWKNRNEVVFCHEAPSLDRLLQTCKEEAFLLRWQLP